MDSTGTAIMSLSFLNKKNEIKVQWIIFTHTPISKNVVGENGEWQLLNGNCTTERNCGFHKWYAKTMSCSHGTKLGSSSNHDDGNKKPTNLHICEWKTVFLHALHVHFSTFDILKMFSFFLWHEKTLFCSCVGNVSIWWQMFNFVDKCSIFFRKKHRSVSLT